ncbi:MAG: hypothetical protein GY765_23715 [bacterium]|nr:hypothetical protein [bacterium]
MMNSKRIYAACGLIVFAVLVLVPQLCSGARKSTADREVDNLVAFTRLYGYIRFFHPADEATQVDWKAFALYGAPKAKTARNTEELEKILKELFLPVAPTLQIYRTDQKPPPVESTGSPASTSQVAWQHLGVQLSSKSNSYLSRRIGRMKPEDTGIESAVYISSSNVRHLAGKKFKLSARIKAEPGDETSGAGLIIEFRDESWKSCFKDYMTDRPIRDKEWKTYQITGKFDCIPYNLIVGFHMIGAGQMWADDLSLQVAGDDGKWETFPAPNVGFDKIDKKGKPSSWEVDTESDDLYRHRVVRENNNNVLHIETTDGFIHGMLFAALPEPGETREKKLAGGLACRFSLSLPDNTAGTPGENENRALETLLSELKKIDVDKADASDEAVRLGDVAIAWNVFQHFYPYFDVVDTDWESVLPETLTKALTDRTANDFHDTLMKMTAKLQDGHGYVSLKRNPAPGGIPIRVEWLQNKLVISASQTPLLKKGDIIRSIDGVKGEDALLEAETYASGSPQLKRYRTLNLFGGGPLGSMAKLLLLRDGKTVEVEIKREEERRSFFSNNVSPFTFPAIREVADGIYYINYLKAERAELLGMMEQLAGARGIIFDIRGDGTIKSPKEYVDPLQDLISHLIDQPVDCAQFFLPNIIYPDREKMSFSRSSWNIEPKAPRFKGQTVFIVTPQVVSFGETIMGIIEHYKLAESVGRLTAGCNGNANFIFLPGGFRVMWTGLKVLKHDGSQHHLVGIAPTVPVEPTLESVLAGKDVFLEKAIEVIRAAGTKEANKADK